MNGYYKVDYNSGESFLYRLQMRVYGNGKPERKRPLGDFSEHYYSPDKPYYLRFFIHNLGYLRRGSKGLFSTSETKYKCYNNPIPKYKRKCLESYRSGSYDSITICDRWDDDGSSSNEAIKVLYGEDKKTTYLGTIQPTASAPSGYTDKPNEEHNCSPIDQSLSGGRMRRSSVKSRRQRNRRTTSFRLKSKSKL
jgi:hypothetical protein